MKIGYPFKNYKNQLLIAIAATTITVIFFLGLINTPINAHSYSNLAQAFWVNVTFIGDAIFAFALVFFMLFFLNQKDISLRLLLCTVLCLAMVQFIKNLFTSGGVQLYFEQGNYINQNDTIFYRSIISSHVAMAVMIAGFLNTLIQKKVFKIGLLMLTLLVIYSRYYLAGEDVFTLIISSLPGLLSLYIVHKISYSKNKKSTYYRMHSERKTHPNHNFQV